MILDNQAIQNQILGMLDRRNFALSNEMPSVWAQRRMHMSEGNFQGALSHDITPYWTEILDNLSPYSGYEDVVLMGASQGGKTKAIIEPIICHSISEWPCNIGYISGNTDLALESMIDLDKAIKNAHINHLIRPSTERTRNSRSGDTNKMKEYPGGNLIGGSATNHKTFRRRNWRLTICDDIEEANDQSAKAGSTVEIIKKRSNSYGKSKKRFWCSTPLRVNGSIIYPLYLKGDQRKYHIPCQCCGVAINLEFEIKIDEKESAGMRWKYDTNGTSLKPGSVEYICQECGCGFSEKNKYKFNKDGIWIPTATPESDTLISYYWNNLYSAPGMDNWDTIVREYISANPIGQPRKEREHQTFWNLRMGLPYEQSAEAPKATMIMGNVQGYKPCTIPESISIAQGNGKIVLITCGADLNGKMKPKHDVDDARLDYVVVAHTESGATYAIEHGSIGTFKPNGGNEDKDRVLWTYEHGKENSVWTEFDKILGKQYPVDRGGSMPIAYTCLDCGAYATAGAYPYLDNTNYDVIGVKGDNEDNWLDPNKNRKTFKPSLERPKDLYLLQVGILKDRRAEIMNLRWDRATQPKQPDNFMNFPHASGGMFEYTDFYSHFESEHRALKTVGEKTEMRWEKKNSIVQNHMWDCFIYAMAGRDILVSKCELKGKDRILNLDWKEFAALLASNIA